MTGAFAWLNDLMTWLGRWVPRLILIPPTHRGVRFGPKGQAEQVGPGLVLYWPITHSVTEVPVTTQSVQICAQALSAPSVAGEWFPRVTICAAAIQFRVTDAVKAATSALNLHALLDNRTSAALTRHSGHAADPATWMTAVSADVGAEIARYGVLLERLDLTQTGTGIALKNLSDWSYADTVGAPRPQGT